MNDILKLKIGLKNKLNCRQISKALQDSTTQNKGTLKRFLQGHIDITFDGHPIFIEPFEKSWFISHKNKIYLLETSKTELIYTILGPHLISASSLMDETSSVLIPYENVSPYLSKKLKKEKYKYLVVVNGDMIDFLETSSNNTFDLQRAANNIPSITISFTCLARIKYKKQPINIKQHEHKQTMSQLINGTFQIINFTPDRIINLRKKDIAYQKLSPSEKRKTNMPAPPELGFVLVKNRWHRAGTVLVRYKNSSYLFGVDENSYFVSELPIHVETVNAAYECLIPKEARGKKGILRQGEWFAVPVNSKSVPSYKTCAAFCDSDDTIILPKDNETSNNHCLCGNVFISTDGIIYANRFTVYHENHRDLRTSNNNQWYAFYRNTAVRSFSQEGVD